MEQAIFTSAQTTHASGYHLACRSSGLSEADAREMTVWGPSHDSLANRSTSARSINFFRLASGSFCISRTITAGEEYSERGGWRVLTHYLVVSPADLLRFANNPFAIVRAALAAGELDPPEVLPQRLERLILAGRAAKVDPTVLYRLSSRISHDEVIGLITAAFEHQQIVVGTDIDADLFVAAIVNTLPFERRPELTFSTGLRYSLQRPFRLVLLPHTAEDELKHAVHSGLEVRRVMSTAWLRSRPEARQMAGV